MPWEHPFGVALRVVGLPAGRYTLLVNDEEPRSVTDEELASFRLDIRP